MISVTTVLGELETIGSRRPEFAYLESKLGDLDPDIRSVTVIRDTFIVNDLLEGYSYMIARSESGYQLTFALRDGSQVIVTVGPSVDVTLVTHNIAKRLTELEAQD
jgi:hypothetical protein